MGTSILISLYHIFQLCVRDVNFYGSRIRPATFSQFKAEGSDVLTQDLLNMHSSCNKANNNATLINYYF